MEYSRQQEAVLRCSHATVLESGQAPFHLNIVNIMFNRVIGICFKSNDKVPTRISGAGGATLCISLDTLPQTMSDYSDAKVT